MWAEMATNYFPTAQSKSLLVNFFTTDAGYIPLPTRIIALIAHYLRISAAKIPHFYTWSAIFGSSFLVIEFCRKPFRVLVENDYLRMFTVLSILLIVDFESRTFINFTYFSAFFIAIHTSRHLCDRNLSVLRSGWIIPVLLLSKPAVLATLPSICVATFFVKSKKVRIYSIISLLCGFGQIVQLAVSRANGAFHSTSEHNLFFKILISIKYFIGFLGTYFPGPRWALNRDLSLFVGICIIGVVFSLWKKKYLRTNDWILLSVGSSLILFNIFLNVFALGDLWGPDLGAVMGAPFHRGIIVSFSGLHLMLLGFIGSIFTHRNKNLEKVDQVSALRNHALSCLALRLQTKFRRVPEFVPPIILVVGMWATGWLRQGIQITRSPGSPLIHNSNWVELSAEIDDNVTPLCVPINPPNWGYNRDCANLNPVPDWSHGIREAKDTSAEIDIKIPEEILNQNLSALAILVRPVDKSIEANKNIELRLSIKVKGEVVIALKNANNVFNTGKLIYFKFKKLTPAQLIETIKISFSHPIEISLTTSGSETTEFLWMGAKL